MAAPMLYDFGHAAKRADLVNAVVRKARVSPYYIVQNQDPRQVPFSRICGGHLEIYTFGGWRRSTDLLNTASH
ncbi:MAG TPA: hypothetical protein VGH91_04690 [Gammaproteobacteria bacterium]|jgi:hypothetical protein